MVTKTRAMIQVELADALRRSGPQRDIRDILDEALRETGDLESAGSRLGIDTSTVSRWIAALRGTWDRSSRTLTFEGFALQGTRELVGASS